MRVATALSARRDVICHVECDASGMRGAVALTPPGAWFAADVVPPCRARAYIDDGVGGPGSAAPVEAGPARVGRDRWDDRSIDRSLAELSTDCLARPVRPDDVPFAAAGAIGRREESLLVLERARRHARELLAQHHPRPVVRAVAKELRSGGGGVSNNQPRACEKKMSPRHPPRFRLRVGGRATRKARARTQQTNNPRNATESEPNK